jgi:hypothetical protein
MSVLRVTTRVSHVIDRQGVRPSRDKDIDTESCCTQRDTTLTPPPTESAWRGPHARVRPRLPASVRQCQTAFRRQNPRAQPWGGHQCGGRDGLQGHLRVDTKPAGNGDQIHCSDVRDCLRSAPGAPYDEVRDPASDSCPGQLDRAAIGPLKHDGDPLPGSPSVIPQRAHGRVGRVLWEIGTRTIKLPEAPKVATRDFRSQLPYLEPPHRGRSSVG